MYQKRIKPRPVKTNCPFCKEGKEPDYKNYEELRTYMSDRGRIISKDRSGICHKHQQRIATQIKRARHLAYLPFVAGL